MLNSAMIKYTNRVILFTNINIVSMDILDNKVHGQVMVYDRFSGKLERSCQYKYNKPYGLYREYDNDRVIYERYEHTTVEQELEITALSCINYVLE